MKESTTDFHYHVAASKWTQIGYHCTKGFFDTKGPWKARAMVHGLKDVAGNIQKDPVAIRQIAIDYYSTLLSTDRCIFEVHAGRLEMYT